MKRITVFFLAICFICLLYGCCSHSSSSFFIKPSGDSVIISREVIIDELGRLPRVTFPSGTTVVGEEENTLCPGIIVTITEQSIMSQNSGYFSDSTNYANTYYLYKITAFQPASNLTGNKTYVTTMEKPFTVSFPNNKKNNGLPYIAIRGSETEPWRFMRLGDPNDITNEVPQKCSFNLHRLSTTFALTAHDNNFPETVVDSVVASSSASIRVKDGKYLEDLSLKGILKGLKLDNIKPADLKARITYRNNKAEEAAIKVNNINVNQSSVADKTVPGYTYYHTFIVNSVLDSSIMSTDGEYSFTLNLKGIETDSFPTGFLIEFYNRKDNDEVLLYNYTEFFTVNRVESVNITLESSEENIINDENRYRLTPTFTLTPSILLDDESRARVAEGISVSDIDSENIVKSWNGNILTLSFSKKLEPDTSYTISMAEPPDIEGCIISAFEDFTFITGAENTEVEIYNITYKLDGGIPDAENPSVYSEASETITLNNPTKEGYTFIGWTGSNGNVPQITVKIEKGSTGDKSYNANYAAVSYIITYNLGANNVENNNPTGFNIASATFTLNAPVREGYKFTGWSGTGIDAIATTVTIPSGSKGDKEYTANWSINSYYLSINKGIGISTVSGEGLHEFGSTFTASCTMLEGYEFASWSGDFTENTITMPAGNATMTANAKPIVYNISYNLKNGSYDEGVTNPSEYDITSSTITLNNPTRTGCVFKGWSGTDLTGIDNTSVNIVQGSIGDREYTANWIMALDLAIASDSGSVFGPENFYLYKFSPTFTITVQQGYVDDEALRASILDSIVVKDLLGNAFGFVSKEWNDDKISLSFSKELRANATYTISCEDTEEVNFTCEPFEFTTFYFKGSGTDGDPYQIETAEQLNLVRNYLDKSFIQMEDINLAQYSKWEPIGDLTSLFLYGNTESIFMGKYNGNYKTISNIKIIEKFDGNTGDYKCGGLFGASGGFISNLNIASVAIILEDNNRVSGIMSVVGGLTGFNVGFIENCSVSNATFNGCSSLYAIGGICGNSEEGSISSCSVMLSNFGNNPACDSLAIGGICGNSRIDIVGCTVSDININSVVNGVNPGSATDCGSFIGGIVGSTFCIKNCNARDININGTISANSSEIFIGGLIGSGNIVEFCSLTKSNSSSEHKLSGSATGNSSTVKIGGIGAELSTYIESSFIKDYEIICENGSNKIVGGICGSIKNLYNSYALNPRLSVANSGDIRLVGGLCGMTNSTGSISSSYVYFDDNYDISGLNFGYLVGMLHIINNSNLYSTITDSFCNKHTDNLRNLVNYIGNGHSITDINDTITDLPNNYAYIVNCYGGVDSFSSFGNKSWSDGKAYNDADSVWKEFNISTTKWPPDLKTLPRGN